MKIYLDAKTGQAISENAIDKNYLADGLADGSITEREATFEECLAECHRLRMMEYPAIGDQLDAAFKARRGDASQQQAIDAQIAGVKAKYPKPVQG